MARWKGRWLTAGALVLATLVSQGCGGLPGSEPSPPPPPPTASVTAGQPGGGSPGGPGSQPTITEDGLAWVPFGPSDANSPDGSGWYRNLEKGDCASVFAGGNSLSPPDPLALALAAVCFAAVKGDQAQWAEAQRLAQQPRVRPTGCLQQAAEDLLARALAWHDSHPGQVPAVTYPRPGGPLACASEFAITHVRTLGDEGTFTGPPQGPVSGGTRVAVVGTRLFGVSEVYIGGKPATGLEQDAFVILDTGAAIQGVSVLTPAAAQAGPADVRVVTAFGEVVAPAAFTYLPASATPSAPSTPDSPAPPSPPGSSPPSSPDGGNTPSPGQP